MTEIIAIEAFQRSRRQLSFRFRAGELRFQASHWSHGVDLHELGARFRAHLMEWIDFHLAAFELNKLSSLAPQQFDLGPFERLWRQVLRGVWAQWRYENNRPDDPGPAFVSKPSKAQAGCARNASIAACPIGRCAARPSRATPPAS